MQLHKKPDRNYLFNYFIQKINESVSTQSSLREPREMLLLEKGREYESKKVEKIIHKNEKEKASASFSPTINSSYIPREKVETRLINYGIKKAAKLEKVLQEKEEISKLSRPSLPIRPNNSEFIKRLESFQSIYAKNLVKQKILKYEQESKLNKSPKICKKSEKIVKDLGYCGKVENRLLEFGELYKDKQISVKAAQKLANSIESIPRISPAAQRLQRNGRICERLIAYSDLYERNKQILTERFYKVSEKNKRKSDPVAQDRLLRAKSCMISQRQYSFSPQLSKRTIVIAKRLGKCSERLVSVSKKNLVQVEDSECFFYPRINKRSQMIFSKNKSDSEFKDCKKVFEYYK